MLNAVSVDVLSTGAMGTGVAVVLRADRERMLFDVPDGTQRLCVERGVRMTRFKRIFLTSLRASSVGGLGGMLLTRADLSTQGESTVIVGPPGTGALFRSFRYFYHRYDAKVETNDMPPGLSVALDGSASASVEVRSLVVRPGAEDGASSSSSSSSSSTSAPMESEPKRSRSGAASSSLHANDAAVSYIVRVPPRRGKFKPDIARALGVEPGRAFGQLTRGESVVTKDGRTVTPEECMDVSDPAVLACVVACPTLAHLAGLDRIPDSPFRELAKAEHPPQTRLGVMVHIGPASVLRSDEYVAWTRRFPADVTHLAVGEGFSPARCLFQGSERLQWRLSAVDANAFPPPLVSVSSAESTAASTTTLPFVSADVGVRFHLTPFKKMGVDVSDVPALVSPDEELRAARELIGASSSSLPTTTTTTTPKNDAAVLFLGTGSAIPSKYRNVSGMLLFPPASSTSLFLDCGEGSFQQLARSLGSAALARAELARTTAIWISHMHGDHHLGTLTVIEARAALSLQAQDTQNPLLVFGPTAMGQFLAEFAALFGPGDAFSRAYRFIDNETTLENATLPRPPGLDESLRASGIARLVSVPVQHCHKAYGLVADFAVAAANADAGGGAGTSMRIVYSGDTEPCTRLVQAGLDADVLIHEATFEDGKEDEAKEKRHSTVSQAISVASRMRAKRVVLFHFSQRYPKLPMVPPKAARPEGTGAISIAFDLRRVSLAASRADADGDAGDDVHWERLSRLFEATAASEALADATSSDDKDE